MNEWNPFLDTEPGNPRPHTRSTIPNRVYARVEGLEVDTNQAILKLDSVDADWFDTVGYASTDDAVFSRTAPLAAIETDLAASSTSLLGALDTIRWLKDPEIEDQLTADDDEAPWFEILLKQEGGFQAQVYLDLRAVPEKVLAQARIPSALAVSRLRNRFSFEGFAVASQQDITNALPSTSIEGVVVYDVGQGNAQGLVDNACQPVVYADFGGGVTANAGTFPSSLKRFCACKAAPVVLSHWDWDHWSSAGLASNLWIRSHTWIAPLQRGLGPSHHTMASAIRKHGTLLLWSSAVAGPIATGAVTLDRCTGRGRNHSGIAVTVHRAQGNPILLPGDARYTAIPSHTASFDSVVAPHHGANMRNNFAPSCPGHAHSRLVYSYGPGNTFRHARHVTRNVHSSRGWLDYKISPATTSLARETEVRSAATGLGHVYVTWRALLAPPAMTCASTCDLAPTQT
jgi:hypothetical protein